VPTLFSADHYLSRGNELGHVAHDTWAVIAALAARTSALRLGTLIEEDAVAGTDHLYAPASPLAEADAIRDVDRWPLGVGRPDGTPARGP
jgi:hypothetical protein